LDDFKEGQRKDWPTYKAEILKLIDDLNASIKNKMKTAQDDEVSAGVSLAEFKLKTEQENKQLDRTLADLAES
jgi:hypothetical protein